MVMWGGQGVPVNWLLCDGRAVSQVTYSRLYQAIGGTWGINQANGTFNLPPAGLFPINAPGFGAVNARGGSQTVKIAGRNLPQIILLVWAGDSGTTVSGGGGRFLGNAGGQSITYWPTQATDAEGNTGQNIPLDIMPPYFAVNFIIKYQ
jgi:microcystin-dependent protein